MQPRTSARVAVVALLAGATGIGFAPVLVRLSEVGPGATAFFRLLFALPWLWLRMRLEAHKADAPRQPATRREFLMIGLAGLCFVGDLSIWHWSLQFTTVANSTLLANCTPVFVTLGAWLFLAERITGVFVLGMALALAGATMLVRVSANLSPQHVLGDTLAVVAAVFYAGYLLTLKQLRRSFSTAAIMAWSGLVCCPGFLMVALLAGDTMLPATARGWQVLLALALLSHVGGQTLIAYAFGHLSASFSSVSLLLQPVVAA